MKESYKEELATHFGLDPYAGDGDILGVASAKSDGSVVPTTQANDAGTEPVTESAQERDSAERNVDQTDLHRAPKRNKRRSLGLAGVRESARNNRELKFTALLHHVNEDLLTEAFFNLKKTAAVGVDEVTWHDYRVIGPESFFFGLSGRFSNQWQLNSTVGFGFGLHRWEEVQKQRKCDATSTFRVVRSSSTDE